MFCVYVQNIGSCALDTVQFATTRSEATVKSDGASIMMPCRCEETRERKTAYGRIQEMFVHSMWPGGPKLVVIQCAWHEEAGTAISTTCWDIGTKLYLCGNDLTLYLYSNVTN